MFMTELRPMGYPVWSPFDAIEAASTMLELLEQNQPLIEAKSKSEKCDAPAS
jgi:hypothetical protein